MSDDTCPRCGREKLEDYPVCTVCAEYAHFPVRIKQGLACVHCERKQARDRAVLVKQQPDGPKVGGIDV